MSVQYTYPNEVPVDERSKLIQWISAHRNFVLGAGMLIGLLIVGGVSIPSFISELNIRSMLLLSAFLGLASIGQTLVALLGGLDLAIPYIIGSANIAVVALIGGGLPVGLSILVVLVASTVVGLINGLLSFRLQNQALVVSLGVGFATVGLTQLLTSSNDTMGQTTGAVPRWLGNLASLNGTTFGIPLPPIVIIWIVLAIVLILIMRATWFGRSIYALGGNRTAARLARAPERLRWVSVYAISGLFSGVTGIALLGFSGGSFVRVGDPYLFLTVAAVAVGGTSLLGGRGGYGSTLLGVLVLTVLTSLLVGYGLDSNGQQFVLGLIIIPLVAIYARKAPIKFQI